MLAGVGESGQALPSKLHELHKSNFDSQDHQLAKEFDRESTMSPDEAVSRASSTNSSDTPREGSDEEPSRQSSSEKVPKETTRDCKNTFRTDNEISADAKLGTERKLVRWQPEPHLQASCGAGAVAAMLLEEIPKCQRRRGQWDQFKANEDLFGFVSTFKTDLSQYTTKIDIKRIPLHAQERAERIAREIETNQFRNGDEDGLERQDDDEEKLFSSVPRFGSSSAAGAPGAAASRSTGTSAWLQEGAGSQKDHSGKQRRLEELRRLHQEESRVAGAYLNVDGVGLMDECAVRSNPWVLHQGGEPVPHAYPGHSSQPVFSTASPQPPPPPPPRMAAPLSMAAAMPAPLPANNYLHVVPTPARSSYADLVAAGRLLAKGTQIVIDGLTNNTTFNGWTGTVEAYDTMNDRYDVLIALQHGQQRAKLKSENLKLLPPVVLQ